jgi:hypothetical protein
MKDPRQSYVDKPLSNQVTEWRPGGMIADQIFGVVVVPQQGGGYYRWNRADTFRRPITTLRAPGTRPRQAEFRVGTDTFYCPNYALGGGWTNEELGNSDFREKYRAGKTNAVKDQLMLDYEGRVTGIVLATGNVGSYSTPASLWSDKTLGNSDPLGDMLVYKEATRLACAHEPDSIAMGKDVFEYLKVHEQIRGILFPHGGGIATEAQLAQVFGVDRVMVGGGMYNTTADDSSTFTLADFWGGNLLLYYRGADTGDLNLPTYGKSLRWRDPGFPEFQVTVHPYDGKARSTDFDVGYYGTEKLTYTDMAFLVQSPI